MRRSTLLLAMSIAVALGTQGIGARDIHVSKTGNDSAAGTVAQPYLTINKAASLAQPGDTVIVHAGTYREWVKPARGSTSEGNRITYRTAPGAEVLVKGSERITSWTPEAGGVWKMELLNPFFGDYNPYCAASFRGLAQLRPVASPRRRLSQWRGLLREADRAGADGQPSGRGSARPTTG